MSGMTAGAGTRRMTHPPATAARRARAVLAAEWIKLRSLRSLLVAPLVTAAVCVVLAVTEAASTASRWSGLDAADKAAFNPLDDTFQFVQIAPLFLGVAGALVVTNEYGRGAVRTTFAATPQRGLVLAAKAVLTGLVTSAVSAVVCFTAFFAGQGMLSGRAPHLSLGDPGVLGHVAGSIYYLTATGLIGLFVGTLVRSAAAAVSGTFALMLVLPILLNQLPADPLTRRAVPYLPFNLGWSLWHSPSPGHVSGGTAVFAVAAWVLGLAALAVLVLRGRDA
jgi:ABC-type transport system involved in multi-copper enzyme maturation permease subunit